ncbi:hypothetical protein GCM10010392_02660 [Streptomyces clavifer]|nr:hypothetical protein GCM10010392_02660 [Streptomyces clavifer]
MLQTRAGREPDAIRVCEGSRAGARGTRRERNLLYEALPSPKLLMSRGDPHVGSALYRTYYR